MDTEQFTIFIYFYSTVTQISATLVGFAVVFIIFQFQFLINSIEKWSLFVVENVNFGKTINPDYYKSNLSETDLIVSQFSTAMTDFEPKNIKNLTHCLYSECELLFKGVLQKSSIPDIFTCASRIEKLVDKYYHLKNKTICFFLTGGTLILLSLISHFVLNEKSICLHSIIVFVIFGISIYFLISIYKIIKVTLF